MTDKQLALINKLLNEIDLKTVRQRMALLRVLANNEYRVLSDIPDGTASSIIWKLQFITAQERQIDGSTI